MSERRVLALDFDGVLWDSVKECYESSCETWRSMGMPPLTQPYERFRKGRWLVRNGREYGVLLRLIEEHPDLDISKLNLSDFAEASAKVWDWMNEFGKILAQVRARFREECPELWYESWQYPFPMVMEAWPLWKQRFVAIVIATTKDRESACASLSRAKLDAPVYGLELGFDKGRHIRQIATDYSVATSDIYFIDDVLVNVQAASRAGAKAFLASWGYNTPEVWREAQALGFTVLNSEDLKNIV